jgi:hypothetical protein
MPLEQILDLAKDKPELVQEIKELADKASAVEKVKEANADLTRQREAWTTKEKDLLAQLEKSSKATGTETPEYRSLKEELAEFKKNFETAQDRANKAEAAKRMTDLKDSIIAIAAPKVHNPNQIVTLMIAEGLIGNDTEGNAFYHKLDDQGKPVAATPEKAFAAFLKSNPHLEKSSGANGSGHKPTNNGATATGLLADPASLL